MPENHSPPGTNAQVPGFAHLDRLVRGYTRAWTRHRDTVNKVYGDVTSQGATVNTWTSGIGSVVSAWTESAKDIYQSVLGTYHGGDGLDDVALAIFVVDRVAEAGADTRDIPLKHPMLDRKRLAATVPTRADGRTLPDDADHGVLRYDLDEAGTTLRLSLANLKQPSIDKSGVYTALVYDNCSPPPKVALARVEIYFV